MYLLFLDLCEEDRYVGKYFSSNFIIFNRKMFELSPILSSILETRLSNFETT